MTRLAARVLGAVKAWGLIVPGDRVVVAVSGGSDSVALAHLLAEIAPSLEATVVALAHLNHRLRGDASDADEQFSRALAATLGWAAVVGTEDVASDARSRHISIERAGHDARRRFFDRTLAETNATVVATGHTADDQAETVLMRLVRGAGTRGLAGIRARRGPVVRPLLGVRRHELVSYLEARHLDWRDDESNRDVSIVRNRVRHELVPLVEQRFSPAIVESLGRLATIARDEDAFLEQVATVAAGSVVSVEGGLVRVDRERLGRLPRAIGRRVLRLALEQAAPGRAFASRHVEAALDVVERKAEGRRLRFPGLMAELTGEGLALRPTVEARARGGWESK